MDKPSSSGNSVTQDAAVPPADAESGPAAAPSTTEPDLTGKTLGDFQILRRLGQGGMGQVYLAEQISLKRQVALKLLRPDLAANASSLQRFKREAEAVARATHANIVQVYYIGADAGIHYMALEYIEGRNLREFLEKKGSPDLLVSLGIMHQVASALQRASELGIVHRDIKPENILISRKGEVKVADFGLFRDPQSQSVSITQSGVTMGTPLYMSPEQVEGKPIDSRTDIYSLGITCYQIFAGHAPFRGNSPYEVALQHVQKEPQPLCETRPDLPKELCHIVHKMLAKKPEERYQTGREIMREVGRLRDSIVGVTSSGSGAAAFNLGPSLRDSSEMLSTQSFPNLAIRPRNWAPWMGAFSLFLALAAGLGIAGWQAASQRQSDTDIPPRGILQADREKDLYKQVQDHLKVDGPLDEVTGLKFSLDLGLLYLNQHRWDEADQFFRELLKPDQKVKNYRNLGELGLAMALAFKDQPKESNEKFLLILEPIKADKGEKLPGNLNHFWYNNPPLREMIAMALQHNFVNNPEAFPARLHRWRLPPMGKSNGAYPVP